VWEKTFDAFERERESLERQYKTQKKKKEGEEMCVYFFVLLCVDDTNNGKEVCKKKRRDATPFLTHTHAKE